MDELTWQPGWVAVPAERQRELVAAICAQERWILDYAYSDWRDLVMDSIIRWHFRSFRRKHERILGWTTDPSLPPVVRLTSPRQTDRWLAGLTGGDTRH